MSLGNGSAEFKFSEVLPIVKDHAVFDVSNYASKITGGKKNTMKRKYKGGHIPLLFSDFKPDTGIITQNPTIMTALRDSSVPEITQGGDNIPNATESDVIETKTTETPISLGGGAAKRRRRKSKRTYKRGGKKNQKKSLKKSNKKSEKK